MHNTSIIIMLNF